ncbi:MAG: hypothetical protein IKQ90_08740, partial [Ruminococcus sp.]|nr:hypothetical protein [Ruminococcus sp.]
MKKHIKKRIFLTLFAGLSASCTIMLCSMGNTNRVRRIEAKVAEAETETSGPMFRVEEYCGRVAVFAGGRSTPLRYIDADIMLMPEYDRECLRRGIDFMTEDELRRYIADIT